jgi:hypothetical protein
MAPNEMTTCRVPRRAPLPRNSSSSSSNRAPSSSSSAAVSISVAAEVWAARRHLGGSSCSRLSVSHPLLLAADQLVAEHGRLEAVGLELDPGRCSTPGSLTARAALGLFDEPHLASARRW